jgi:hypothetical protein
MLPKMFANKLAISGNGPNRMPPKLRRVSSARFRWRAQQAQSWELRAAMSLARLWRDQGKVQQARELSL